MEDFDFLFSSTEHVHGSTRGSFLIAFLPFALIFFACAAWTLTLGIPGVENLDWED